MESQVNWKESMKSKATELLGRLREGKERAKVVLNDIEQAGLSVELDGDNLRIKPQGLLSQGLRQAIKESKSDIIVILRERERGTEQPPPAERVTPGNNSFDWRVDWRDEWCWMVGELTIQLHSATDADAQMSLYMLATRRPRTEKEFHEWRRLVVDVKKELDDRGVLPPIWWPGVSDERKDEDTPF